LEITPVLARVGRIGAVRANGAAGRVDRESALVEVRRVRAWLDASEADLVLGQAAEVSFPEQAIAETSKGSLGQASTVMERAATLDAVPAMAAALDRGAVTAGHVDAITRAAACKPPTVSTPDTCPTDPGAKQDLLRALALADLILTGGTGTKPGRPEYVVGARPTSTVASCINVVWWRHGGCADLDNLLPVCVRHHHKIHEAGWNITLGPNRQLTIHQPDGTVQSTGPPGRCAA
jgi:hypothetical protein